jgi:hypothetical protein
MTKKLPYLSMLLLLSAVIAKADTQTFTTPAGSTTSGGAVDASASIVTGAGTVTITLTDLEANPGNVAQLISDFDFVLSTGAKTGTLSSSSGEQITIGSGGTATLGTTGSTGWGVNDSVGGGIQLDALGFIGPAGLIIGPGPYTDANSSIAGNGPHNPFLDQTATFVLAVTGVTVNTSITSTTFSFGTTGGIDVDGTPGGSPPPTPEPSSLLLLGTGIFAAALFLRQRSAQSRA